MKHKKTVAGVLFLLFGLGRVLAQETVTTTGGEATGVGGTVSYTVGQVVYTTNTDVFGTISQGVQQAYEIFTVGIKEKEINLEVSIYPNPTTDILTLKTKKNEGLTYYLYDLQGKVIAKKTVNSTSTDISFEGQPTATYFLSVIKNEKVIKTFKVIKK